MSTRIAPDSLMTLEAYAKVRKTIRPQVIAHRRLRTVRLGEHLGVQFEDEQTIRRQIQEMLHIEKIFDEQGIQAEIDAYAPLVPDGSALTCMPCAMWWPASWQSEAMWSGPSLAIALNTGLPIFIAIGCVGVFTP